MSERIVVISTGGTIASRYDAGLVRVVAVTRGEELIAALGAAADLPPLEIDNFSTIASFDLSIEDATRLAHRINSVCARDDVTGVVVTQGTDTMEETSFLAALLLRSDKPLVFTGAQLAADEPQSDGPRNLRNAIRAACNEALTGIGAVVCFNGELHAARDVAKTHASALETFQSPGIGPLGVVDRDKVIIRRHPAPLRRFTIDRLDKRVDLIKVALDMDDVFVHAALAAGAQGIVLEGSGRGHVTPKLVPSVHRLAKEGFPIVITSRCPVGRVEPIYGSKHGTGGRDLQDAGVIFGGDLKGTKARILLMVALADAQARGDLKQVFADVAP
ncbi:MAG: asparaginase [Burkholderiales bacterium]